MSNTASVQLEGNNQKNGETSESIMTRSWTIPACEGPVENDNMKEVTINIIGKLDQLHSTTPRSYISRVHRQLRTVNEKAYEPMLVSIGPYHYDKRKTDLDLQYMEQHKLRYLDDLIKRRETKNGISRVDQLSEYLKVLEELEDRARCYYEEAVTLEKIAFLEMMLLDGCFIIELFQRATWSHSEHEREPDPVTKADWIPITLQRDLMLLENQIPFFVLERLYSIIGDLPDPFDLILKAVDFLGIYNILPPAQSGREYYMAEICISDLAKDRFAELPPMQRRRLDRKKLNDFKHLLDLARKFMLVEETLEIKDGSALLLNQGPPELKKSTSRCSRRYTFSAIELNESGVRFNEHTYSAIKLSELGVRFKGVEKSKFYEITFEDGLLEIPVIQIADDTEVRFRNLIAYEEHGHCAGETFYIGDYMNFMDGLVNTAKDVELLRQVGIIESLMGDDEEVANMFNNMGKNRILMSYYYARIVDKLTEHCRKRRTKWVAKLRRWMAKLRRNYLNSPWTIISVIAASVLLILTITQTVYSALSYNNA